VRTWPRDRGQELTGKGRAAVANSFRLDEREQSKSFASYLKRLEDRLAALERANPLTHASIEGGSIDVYDDEGELRGSIGVQPDGTVGVVPVNSTPPPTPTVPVLEPVLAGLLVTWDGAWADAEAAPLDFARVQVHIGTEETFEPTLETIAATISNRDGGTATISTPGYAAAWVRLVAVNSAEDTGPASAAAQGTPRQVRNPDLDALLDLAAALQDESVAGTKLIRETIGADQLAANAVVAGKVDAGAVTAREIAAGAVQANHIVAGAINAEKLSIGTAANLVPDPSFEGPYSAVLAQNTGEHWTVVAGGNGSPKAMQVNAAAAVPTIRSLVYPAQPILPGEQLALSVDYRCSADWAGESVRVYTRWLDAAGAAIGFGICRAEPPVLDSWQAIQGTVTAPAGAVQVQIALATYNSTAGSVLFDNAAARPVVARVQIGDGAITAEKLAADAINGKVVTGALIRTAAEGRRLALDPDGAGTGVGALEMYSGHPSEGGPGRLHADVSGDTTSSGEITTMTDPGDLGAYVRLSSPHVGSDSASLTLESATPTQGGGFRISNHVLSRVHIKASGPSDGSQAFMELYASDLSTSPGGGGFSHYRATGKSVEIKATSSATGLSSALSILAEGISASSGLDVAKILTAGNFRWGATRITPTAADTPTSVAVAVPPMSGTEFAGFATALSTVPGTSMKGVSVSGLSATGLTVWLTRSTTVSTTVFWLLIGL
jgi:hypothetical protein